jgi:hypothetical protein
MTAFLEALGIIAKARLILESLDSSSSGRLGCIDADVKLSVFAMLVFANEPKVVNSIHPARLPAALRTQWRFPLKADIRRAATTALELFVLQTVVCGPSWKMDSAQNFSATHMPATLSG